MNDKFLDKDGLEYYHKYKELRRKAVDEYQRRFGPLTADEAESREVVAKLQQTSERFLNMPIDCLGYIFEDTAVMRSVRRQTPFLAAQPGSVAARCIQAMANSVLYGSRMKVKRGWKGFLRQIFDFSR